MPAFSKSSEFAIDKPGRTACPNLQADYLCGIHVGLRGKGFSGCTVYDCFGAGQHVVALFGGLKDPGMLDVFGVVRDLHELLFYLDCGLAMQRDVALGNLLRRERARIEKTSADRAALTGVDIGAQRRKINDHLLRASEIARSHIPVRPEHRGANLLGAKLGGADLRGATLRGACLIGADLRGADLRLADVIGADFRGASLAGADLRGCLFLIQSQLDSAHGDGATRIPVELSRPSHWLVSLRKKRP